MKDIFCNQNASKVMVFGVFFKEEHTLKFIIRGDKVNLKLYLNDILKSHIKPYAIKC